MLTRGRRIVLASAEILNRFAVQRQHPTRTTTRVRASLCATLLSLAAALLAGCGAVFPELGTPVRDVPPGYRFDPPPPPDLVYLAFARAVIPARTRDGRAWDSVGGSLPDPFAKLIVDDKDLIVTPIHSNTLTPTWPNQKRGNYRVRLGATIKVELWDSNPINNHPICAARIYDFHEQVSAERHLEVNCESGAHLELVVEPAHGKVGLGLSYEIRTDHVYVTRVLSESPASRAGIRRGEEIVQVMGEPARGMPEGRVRSLMNANGSIGLELVLLGADKTERRVTIKDGPIYPTLAENVR